MHEGAHEGIAVNADSTKIAFTDSSYTTTSPGVYVYDLATISADSVPLCVIKECNGIPLNMYLQTCISFVRRRAEDAETLIICDNEGGRVVEVCPVTGAFIRTVCETFRPDFFLHFPAADAFALLADGTVTIRSFSTGGVQHTVDSGRRGVGFKFRTSPRPEGAKGPNSAILHSPTQDQSWYEEVETPFKWNWRDTVLASDFRTDELLIACRGLGDLYMRVNVRTGERVPAENAPLPEAVDAATCAPTSTQFDALRFVSRSWVSLLNDPAAFHAAGIKGAVTVSVVVAGKRRYEKKFSGHVSVFEPL